MISPALSLGLVALLVAGGCSDRERKRPPPRDPQPPRRVIEPPTGTVRPLPPYTIKPEGVGPYYTLNESIASLLQQLPSGPRITRFEIEGLVETNVIRAEDDAVLIGGETNGTAQFIAVVGAEVARTDTGVKVGSNISELVNELGPITEELERVRDPRLASVASLKNVRVILDDDRIAAFVVAADPVPTPRKDTPGCSRPKPRIPRTFGACLTGSGEIVEVEDNEISVYLPDADRKPIATLRVPNLVFAGALRNAVEGRDELVAITRTDTGQVRSWALVAYRVEATKFVRVVDPEPVYRVSAAQARWIGAELANLDLYLEIAHRTDGIEVGGLLTSWRGDKIRDVAVISPVVVTRRGAAAPKPAGTEAAAGAAPEPIDAGVPALPEDAPKSGAGSAAP